MKSESEVAQSCLTVTPWTVAHQASLSMGILQERILEWVAISFPGDLPDPGSKPGLFTLQADCLPSKPPGKTLVQPLLLSLPTTTGLRKQFKGK